VRLVTGHLKTGGELDWANLAVEKQTLVFYMGLKGAADHFLRHGGAVLDDGGRHIFRHAVGDKLLADRSPAI
jgi:hypothetical protein